LWGIQPDHQLTRVNTARHAKAPSGANVTIMRASSIESTRHPSAKLKYGSSLETVSARTRPDAIAEAEKKEMPAERSGSTEAPDTSSALLAVKDMEQSRVDHGIELLTQGTEVEGIAHEKPDGEATSTGLVSGDGYRPRGRIHGGGFETLFSREQSMLARTTTHI
jgi:hypothetical protein